MDNSLIPRAFSPTDAKRRAEENAREAERRTSARNASSSTIPAGGLLTLAGGIEVVDGGTVDVVGMTYTDAGDPYEVRSELTTVDVETNYGTGASPALRFTTDMFGESARARVYSTDGRSVDLEGYQAGEGAGATTISPAGFSARFADDGPEYGNATGKYRETEVYAGRYGFHMRFNDGAISAYSNVTADGNGNIDIATSGALTHNGAPIGSGGGGGAVSSVAGRTGDVVLAKADVGLSSVDNTADLDKPVSTATQAALNGKASTTHTHAITDVTGLAARLDNLDANTPTEITYATGYSHYSPNPAYRHASWIKQGNIVRLMGMLGTVNGTISMTAGTLYTVGSIPASIAPTMDDVFGIIVSSLANRTGLIYVLADGTIKFTPHQTFTGITQGQFYLTLGSVWWPR